LTCVFFFCPRELQKNCEEEDSKTWPTIGTRRQRFALMMHKHSLCAKLDERTLLKSTNSTGLRRDAAAAVPLLVPAA